VLKKGVRLIFPREASLSPRPFATGKIARPLFFSSF